MQMYFIFSDHVTLLFDFWTVQTLAGRFLMVLQATCAAAYGLQEIRILLSLVVSFVVVLLLTVLYEISKVWKSNLLTRVLQTLPLTPDSAVCPPLMSDTEANSPAGSDTLLGPDPLFPGEDSAPSVQLPPSSTYRWWLLHSLLALLHTAQVFLGYVVMLCVMSYNAAIFIAVVLGSALGYYVAFPLLVKYPKPHNL